jgi:UPF0755 protein
MIHLSKKNVFLASVAFVFFLAVFLSLGLGIFLISPSDRNGKEETFVVKEGSSLKEVAQDLELKHLVKSKTLFVLWARMMGYSKGIKSGEYILSASMPPVKILEKLRLGLIQTHIITIPEGYTRKQIAALLHERGLADKNEFLTLTENASVLKRYGISGPTLEGYLFPDTYLFARGISATVIVETMVRRFWQMVGPFMDKAKETGMTMEEIITLASIVEKETGRPEEKPLIASVFLNRLKRGMRLDSDPTVIYGMDRFDGNLRKDDLSRQTPYNTYIIHGLTPGPICSPGLDSIKAVLYPAKTDYLYFVSRNDGSHQFSRTLSEHNRAVKTFQKRRSEKTS